VHLIKAILAIVSCLGSFKKRDKLDGYPSTVTCHSWSGARDVTFTIRLSTQVRVWKRIGLAASFATTVLIWASPLPLDRMTKSTWKVATVHWQTKQAVSWRFGEEINRLPTFNTHAFVRLARWQCE
jgi:hypothetical protein